MSGTCRSLHEGTPTGRPRDIRHSPSRPAASPRTAEEVLDQVPPPVEFGIPGDRLHAAETGRDAPVNPPLRQRPAEPVDVVAATRHEPPRNLGQVADEPGCPGAAADPASGRDHPNRPPDRVRHRVELRVQAALRPTDAASVLPLPELQGQGGVVRLGCVASIISVSFASAKASNIRRKTPLSLHRFQRLQNILDRSFSGGASHHRNPRRN